MQQTNNIHYSPFDPMKSRPLNTPIFQTSTFYFNNFNQLEKIFSFQEKNFVYTRGGNPTVNLLEARLAKLEKGKDAVCFSSGMGAISSTLMSLLKSGDTLVVSDVVYGSTMGFVKNILKKFQVKIKVIDLTDIEALKNLLKQDKNIKAIFFETPCNPTLKLIDIKAVSDLASQYNAKVIVDNTFSAGYIQKPLEFGADIVVHSLTKYINGHGDALGGVAISKDEQYITKLKFMYMCDIGSVMDPNSAFLILRGLKTLDIRMRKHQDNALKVAQFLEQQNSISKVIYPGLQNYEFKHIKDKQMNGNGAIIAFHLQNKDISQVKHFIEKLNVFKLAVSLGDTESLIEYPLLMTHREYMNDIESKVYKQLESLVRLSIGLEDNNDLIDDLKQALKS